MPVRLQVSQDIERSVADVFRFFAIEHVRNHPAGIHTCNLNK